MEPTPDLVAAVANRKAIIVAGAGIAALFNPKFKSWVHLVKALCDLAEVEMTANSSATDLAALAGNAMNVLQTSKEKKETLVAFLKSSFDLPPNNSNLAAALKGLDIPIITTNYDYCIENAFGQEANTIVWNDLQQVRDFVSDPMRHCNKILHIHGVWDRLETLVLDENAYKNSHDHVKHILTTLSSRFQLIFIGCDGTLGDPNFEAIMELHEHTYEAAKNEKHIILCRSPLVSVIENPNYGRLARTGLPGAFVTLCYGAQYSDLVTFLKNTVAKGSLNCTTT